jgi:hypothetical protein
MTQNKLKTYFIVGTLAAAAVLVIGFSVKAAETANKEYRNGTSVAINGKTYLLVTTGSAVEIMSFNQASNPVLEAELRLPQNIKDVVTTAQGGETYAIVTTGRYLYRVKITNPKNMEVVLKHDNYQYSKGRNRTGSIDALATNGKALYTAGQFGVRRMDIMNLQVEKIMFYDKAYGVAVNNKVLYVLGEQKAFEYSLDNGQKLMEVDVKNADKLNRKIAVDKNNNGYVVSDNAVIKMVNKKAYTYTNPVKNLNFSYAVTAGDAVYYVNGLGVTKLDMNFKKQGFFVTAQSKMFGERAFAVGVLTVNVNGGEKVVVLNKSGIVVMAPNLKVIAKYRGNSALQANPDFALSFDHQYFMTNQAIVAKMSGFYPNETVKLTIGGKTYQVRSNNSGEAMISFVTPSNPGRYVVDIRAPYSEVGYQQVREVK